MMLTGRPSSWDLELLVAGQYRSLGRTVSGSLHAANGKCADVLVHLTNENGSSVKAKN